MSLQTATPVSDGGFFSAVGQEFKDLVGVVGDTARAVLPVWTARQLDLQDPREFQQPLFQPVYAPPRVDGGSLDTTAAPVSATQEAGPKKAALVQFGGVEISGLAIVVGLVGAVAAYALLR